MVKNLHSLLLFMVCSLPISMVGQVTITNSTFPVAGDTLRTISSSDVGSFDRTAVGENVTWDLSGAGAGQVDLTIYADPMEGDSFALFPDADMLDVSTPQEIYYQSFNNKVVELGRSGLDPVVGLLNLNYNNEGESVLRRAPMSYNDVYSDESSFKIAASASVIPDSILGGLAGAVDSLRLSVETANDDEVDAWGKLTLPGNNEYDVLRIKRTTVLNSGLEAKLPILGWVTVDPSNPLFAALGDLLALLGETTTTSYQFYANGVKEVVANISTDEDDAIIGITYKAEGTTSTVSINPNTQNIKAYPNPTYGDITFDLSDLPKDEYSLVVFNIVGKKLWSSEINSSGVLKTNLQQLQKGTYFYSILDGSGRKVTTRRLVLITP